jgi:hypothetical protein
MRRRASYVAWSTAWSGCRERSQDHDARCFAVGFYRALGNRRSMGQALEHAVATLAANQLANQRRPRLRTRTGIDPNQLVLTSTT